MILKLSNIYCIRYASDVLPLIFPDRAAFGELLAEERSFELVDEVLEAKQTAMEDEIVFCTRRKNTCEVTKQVPYKFKNFRHITENGKK